MGIFDFLKGFSSSRFVSKKQAKDNLQSQLRMTPQTLEQLKGSGVTEDTKLKLEFFFYTNTSKKAEQLTSALRTLEYDAEFKAPEGYENILIVTGWTTKIKMDPGSVQKWTENMIKLGYEYDADFDGWGTNPKQEQ